MYISTNLREKFKLVVPGTLYEKKLQMTSLSYADKIEIHEVANEMRLNFPIEKSPNFDDIAFRRIIDIGLEHLYKSQNTNAEALGVPEPDEYLMNDFELVITE